MEDYAVALHVARIGNPVVPPCLTCMRKRRFFLSSFYLLALTNSGDDLFSRNARYFDVGRSTTSRG